MALTRQMSKKMTDQILGTGASTMTLNTWEKKAKTYQTIISLIIIIIAFISFIQLLFGVFLVKVYHITTLDFSSDWFTIAPFTFVGVGASTVIICIFGLIIFRFENRPLVIIVALLFSAAFLAELFALFAVTKIDSIVVHDDIEHDDIREFMRNYRDDDIVAEKWDAMQIGLRCCGADGKEMKNGYKEWKAYLHFPPDSCCHKPQPGICQQQNRTTLDERVIGITKPCGCDTRDEETKDMYRTGCIGLLLEMLKNEIFEYTNIFLVVGVILGILELITVMLSATYNARLSRRITRNK